MKSHIQQFKQIRKNSQITSSTKVVKHTCTLLCQVLGINSSKQTLLRKSTTAM